MKILFIVLNLTVLIVSHFTEDEGVIVVTKHNIEDVIRKFPYFVLYFYSPDCGHCKDLAPKYSKAAMKLKLQSDDNGIYIPLAKVNGVEEVKLIEKYNIKCNLSFLTSLPNTTILWGQLEVDNIVEWISNQSGPTAKLLKLEVEVNEWIKKASQSVGVIYYADSEEDPLLKIYLSFADKRDILLAYTLNPIVLKKQQITDENRVVMYKNFEESEVIFQGQMNIDNFNAWLYEYATPSVMPMNPQAVQIVFQDGDPALLLFYSEKNNLKEFNLFKSIARKLNHYGVRFIYIDQNNNAWNQLVEFMQIDITKLPQLGIIHPNEEFSKFLFVQDFNEKNIESFLIAFTDRVIQPHFKSQDPPSIDNELVKVVVGKTFKQIVLDNTKDVLVAFYLSHCLEPIYQQLAERLKNNENIVIAKIDASKNEVNTYNIQIQSIKPQGYPALYFYPKGMKEHPVKLEEAFTLDYFIAFLQEYTTHEWIDIVDYDQDDDLEQQKESDL